MKQFRLMMILSALSLSVFNLKASDIRIKNLQTEYSQTPLGIDIGHPRFSWQMESDKPGCYQIAYQIIVFSDASREVWNSGEVLSNESLNIRYDGDSLKPETRYKWQLIVWDQDKMKHIAESWFETGLMDYRETAWGGAKWIGGNDNDLVLYSQYLPVFKINFTVQLDDKSNSTKAGFIYGANDGRLLDKNKNIYKLENKKDSSYILVELDITSLNSNGRSRLNVYRVGYIPNDKMDKPIKSFEISPNLINNQNRFDRHAIFLSSNLGQTEFYVDDTEFQVSIKYFSFTRF